MRAQCVAMESGADRLPPSPDRPPDPRAKLLDDDLLDAAKNARHQ
jgi:hypothetical protein